MGLSRLLGGEVFSIQLSLLEFINPKDENSKILRETGDFIQNDKRVYNTLFPIRDGK